MYSVRRVADASGGEFLIMPTFADENTAADRLPPNSPEAERGLLGCILWSPNEGLAQCGLKLEPPAFYDLRHQTIYKAMLDLAEAVQPVTVASVFPALKDSGHAEQVGGASAINGLLDETPSAANLDYYLSTVLDKWMLRRMIRTCSDIIGKAYASHDPVTLLDAAEREILEVRRSGGKEQDNITQLCRDTITELQTMFASKGKISGLSTGIHDLDRITDGLHGGEMVVVAAFPSVGKTAWSMQMAIGNALQGVPVAIFSCEMRPVKLVARAVCAEARVNMFDVRDGFATENDFARMATTVSRIAKQHIFIENSNGYTVGQVVARARRLHQQHNIALVVVDYIQLLSCEAGSREQEISGISKGLKGIAMELNVPVIALSQLNDDGKLRESRAIGQDADSVWKLENDGEWQPKVQPVKLIVEKNREGPTGVVRMVFLKTVTRFEAAGIDAEDVPATKKPYKE